jgi:large conductance mechanosensitive channel
VINVKKFIQEYKVFTLRGNMVDLAIGIIIGGAFNKVVSSMVNDIVMPPMSFILKRVKFNDMFISLNGESYQTLQQAKDAGAPTINYGNFITEAVNLVVLAFVLFLVIKQINKLRQRMQDIPQTVLPNSKSCPECLSDIPIKAKRCKFCTCVVPLEEKPATL